MNVKKPRYVWKIEGEAKIAYINYLVEFYTASGIDDPKILAKLIRDREDIETGLKNLNLRD